MIMFLTYTFLKMKKIILMLVLAVFCSLSAVARRPDTGSLKHPTLTSSENCLMTRRTLTTGLTL